MLTPRKKLHKSMESVLDGRSVHVAHVGKPNLKCCCRSKHTPKPYSYNIKRCTLYLVLKGLILGSRNQARFPLR